MSEEYAVEVALHVVNTVTILRIASAMTLWEESFWTLFSLHSCGWRSRCSSGAWGSSRSYRWPACTASTCLLAATGWAIWLFFECNCVWRFLGPWCTSTTRWCRNTTALRSLNRCFSASSASWRRRNRTSGRYRWRFWSSSASRRRGNLTLGLLLRSINF